MRYIFLLTYLLITSPLARAEDTLIARYELTASEDSSCAAPVIGSCPECEGRCCIFGEIAQDYGTEEFMVVNERGDHLRLEGIGGKWLHQWYLSSRTLLPACRVIEVYQSFVRLESLSGEVLIINYFPLGSYSPVLTFFQDTTIALGLCLGAAMTSLPFIAVAYYCRSGAPVALPVVPTVPVALPGNAAA